MIRRSRTADDMIKDGCMSLRPVAAIAMFSLLAGCAAGDPPAPEPRAASARPAQPSPSQSPSPAAASSSPATSPAGPQPQALEIDTIAEVVTTDLVMRSLPGVTDESVILDRVLQPGDRLFVIAGPHRATFYDWFFVQPFGGNFQARPAGWVAAADCDGEPWIARATVACPDAEQPDVFELDALHPYELLHCFGDRQISVTVQAMGICSGYIIGEPNYTIEPAWLGMGSTCGWGREGEYLGAMQPYLEPSIGNQYPPSAERLDWYLLTGQFDHPEAANCVLRELAGGHPQMPPMPDLISDQVVLGCRAHFAVVRAEEIGAPAL